jgi:hypothetical protein
MGSELLRRLLYSAVVLLMVADFWATAWANQLQAEVRNTCFGPARTVLIDPSQIP